MPNPNLTSVLVVLDRSGSMETLREATVGGLNQFFGDQRSQPGEVRLTLVQFDHQYEMVRDNVDLKTMPDLTQDDFQPRGWTALFDAIGKAMTDFGDTLAGTPEEQRPGTVFVVIQTDGADNRSREFTAQQINDKIKHQTEKYSWKFVFLGANQDALGTASTLGISPAMALSYNANVGSTAKAFQAVSQVASFTRSGGTRGQSATLDSYSKYVADDSAAVDSALNTSYANPDPKDSDQT